MHNVIIIDFFMLPWGSDLMMLTKEGGAEEVPELEQKTLGFFFFSVTLIRGGGGGCWNYCVLLPLSGI